MGQTDLEIYPVKTLGKTSCGGLEKGPRNKGDSASLGTSESTGVLGCPSYGLPEIYGFALLDNALRGTFGKTSSIRFVLLTLVMTQKGASWKPD